MAHSTAVLQLRVPWAIADPGMVVTTQTYFTRTPQANAVPIAEYGIVFRAATSMPVVMDGVTCISAMVHEASEHAYFTSVFRSFKPTIDPKRKQRTEFRKLLRAISRLIAQFIRRLDGMTGASEFTVKFRPFHLIHGDHPPDLSASTEFILISPEGYCA